MAIDNRTQAHPQIMPEQRNSRPYWYQVISRALSESGKITAFSGLGGALIGVTLAVFFGFAQRSELPKMAFIIAASAIAGVLIEFLIRCFFIPPKMAREQKDKINELEIEIQTKLDGLAIADAERKAKEHEENAKAIEKGSTDLMLGTYFKSIEFKIEHLKILLVLGFKDDEVFKMVSESTDLCSEIHKFVEGKIGPLEGASFVGTSDITRTPVDRSTQDADGQKEIIQGLIDLLSRRSFKLSEIMKQRMKTS